MLMSKWVSSEDSGSLSFPNTNSQNTVHFISLTQDTAEQSKVSGPTVAFLQCWDIKARPSSHQQIDSPLPSSLNHHIPSSLYSEIPLYGISFVIHDTGN